MIEYTRFDAAMMSTAWNELRYRALKAESELRQLRMHLHQFARMGGPARERARTILMADAISFEREMLDAVAAERLKRIDELMEKDPEPLSPEGVELNRLVDLQCEAEMESLRKACVSI